MLEIWPCFCLSKASKNGNCWFYFKKIVASPLRENVATCDGDTKWDSNFEPVPPLYRRFIMIFNNIFTFSSTGCAVNILTLLFFLFMLSHLLSPPLTFFSFSFRSFISFFVFSLYYLHFSFPFSLPPFMLWTVFPMLKSSSQGGGGGM